MEFILLLVKWSLPGFSISLSFDQMAVECEPQHSMSLILAVLPPAFFQLHSLLRQFFACVQCEPIVAGSGEGKISQWSLTNYVRPVGNPNFVSVWVNLSKCLPFIFWRLQIFDIFSVYNRKFDNFLFYIELNRSTQSLIKRLVFACEVWIYAVEFSTLKSLIQMW